MEFFCYRHIRNDTGVPFYVGIGNKRLNPNPTRLDTEYKRAFSLNYRNDYWHHVHDKINGDFNVEILYESDSREEIIRKEIEFIKLHGRSNLGLGSLVNLTDGGEGAFGWIPDAGTRIKMSINSKGRKHTEEFKKETSARFLRLFSERPEFREQSRANGLNNKGKKRTEEQKLLLSISRKNNPGCQAKIRKVSEGNIGRIRPEHLKVRHSEYMKEKWRLRKLASIS